MNQPFFFLFSILNAFFLFLYYLCVIDCFRDRSPKHEPLTLHRSENSTLPETKTDHLLLEKNLPLEKTLSASPSVSATASLAPDTLHGMLVWMMSQNTYVLGRNKQTSIMYIVPAVRRIVIGIISLCSTNLLVAFVFYRVVLMNNSC